MHMYICIYIDDGFRVWIECNAICVYISIIFCSILLIGISSMLVICCYFIVCIALGEPCFLNMHFKLMRRESTCHLRLALIAVPPDPESISSLKWLSYEEPIKFSDIHTII